MREDIAKVIVERPRLGSRSRSSDDPKGYNRKRYGKDYILEDLPQKESMSARRRYGWDAKELNENLSPLRRFLEKNVGRPWDKVFSELSEHIDLNSTVKRHIWQHVFDFVEKNTFMGDDGKVWVHSGYGSGDHPLEAKQYYTRAHLYIHPKDGLLKKVKVKPDKDGAKYKQYYHNKPVGFARHDFNKTFQYHKQNGIWYIIELKKIPLGLTTTVELDFGEEDEKISKTQIIPTENGRIMDAVFNYCLHDLIDDSGKEKTVGKSFQVKEGDDVPYYRHVGEWVYYDETLSGMYGRKGVYGSKIKQANSKELKQAGLKNDPPIEPENAKGQWRKKKFKQHLRG